MQVLICVSIGSIDSQIVVTSNGVIICGSRVESERWYAFCVFLVLEGVDLLRVSHIQHPKTCSKPCRQTSELSQ